MSPPSQHGTRAVRAPNHTVRRRRDQHASSLYVRCTHVSVDDTSAGDNINEETSDNDQKKVGDVVDESNSGDDLSAESGVYASEGGAQNGGSG